MKILLDIHHPADVNFFKNAVGILKKDYGCEFTFVVRPRGRLVDILKNELGNVPRIEVSTHRSSLAGKILTMAEYSAFMLAHKRTRDFDIATAFNGVGICHVTTVLHKPSVIFDDDIEYKLQFKTYKPFATRIVLPDSLPVEGRNIVRYRGFKELAYLHPRYFKPDVKALDEYGLVPLRYVFIREVSSSSLNYQHLKMGRLAGVCSLLKERGLDIVLSLEDKSLTPMFEKQCTILKEPVGDVYSLLHYAMFTVSSGDTVARESPLVGTPIIYTGGRKMSVNRELVKKDIFFEADETAAIMALADTIVKDNMKHKTQEIVRQAIANEWEDTTQVIVKNLMEVFQTSQGKRAGRRQ